MAERLTKKIVKTVQDKYSLGQYLYYDFAGLDDTNKLLNKLGKLEDILEKYGIESVEELETKLQSTNEDIKKAQQKLAEIYIKDRDTWKRACELACRHIAEVEWLSCPETDDISASENEIATLTKQALNYFYQQAQQVISKLPVSKRESDEQSN